MLPRYINILISSSCCSLTTILFKMHGLGFLCTFSYSFQWKQSWGWTVNWNYSSGCHHWCVPLFATWHNWGQPEDLNTITLHIPLLLFIWELIIYINICVNKYINIKIIISVPCHQDMSCHNVDQVTIVYSAWYTEIQMCPVVCWYLPRVGPRLTPLSWPMMTCWGSSPFITSTNVTNDHNWDDPMYLLICWLLGWNGKVIFFSKHLLVFILSLRMS